MFDFDTFGGGGLFTVFNICQPLDIVRTKGIYEL